MTNQWCLILFNSLISRSPALQLNREKNQAHLLQSSPPHLTLNSPAWKRIQGHTLKIRASCRSTLYVHAGRRPAVNLLLTTPISPGSVSVCFTVTWITELGRFRASIIMATLSGTVLLFLLDSRGDRQEINKACYETGRWEGFTSAYPSMHHFYAESSNIHIQPLVFFEG